MSDLLESWLILSRTPQLGPRVLRPMLAHFGSAQAVIAASHQERLDSGLFRKATLAHLARQDFSNIQVDTDLLATAKVHAVHWGHPDYPSLLTEITDPPLLLFVQGNPVLLSMPQVAMVGSRNADQVGLNTAFGLAKQLAQNGMTVTSGMALGIDAAAHRGALQGNAKTVAVVGTGLDTVYPARHQKLAEQISQQGVLVSEFGAGMGPRAENFPRRNRIISGLALGTVVVQAALRSGSLITARTAMEQGREVFAVPGSVKNPLARGCHHLLKQGASLVEEAADIVTTLGGMLAYSQEQSEIVDTGLLSFISYDPMLVDALPQASGWTMSAVNATLLDLELQGKIALLPGAKVQRI